MQADYSDVVEEFVNYIEQIPFDSDDDWDSDLDEDAYRAEQTAHCHRISRSTGPLVYNALLFLTCGASQEAFSADWMKQHAPGRFVLLVLGKGYFAVLLSTLADTLKTLDRITRQTHPFYAETNRQCRIPNDPTFADKVRDWHPVWCANELFVRFATTDDRVMDYSVLYSDYDAASPAPAPAPAAAPADGAGAVPSPSTSSSSWPSLPSSSSAFSAAARPPAAVSSSVLPVPSRETPVSPVVANGGPAPSTAEEDGPARKKPKRTPQEKENSRRVKEASKDLPTGWRAFIDPNGNLYYGHLATGAASWVRPPG